MLKLLKNRISKDPQYNQLNPFRLLEEHIQETVTVHWESLQEPPLQLPEDCWLIIFTFILAKEFKLLRLVCKPFYHFIHSNPHVIFPGNAIESFFDFFGRSFERPSTKTFLPSDGFFKSFNLDLIKRIGFDTKTPKRVPFQTILMVLSKFPALEEIELYSTTMKVSNAQLNELKAPQSKSLQQFKNLKKLIYSHQGKVGKKCLKVTNELFKLMNDTFKNLEIIKKVKRKCFQCKERVGGNNSSVCSFCQKIYCDSCCYKCTRGICSTAKRICYHCFDGTYDGTCTLCLEHSKNLIECEEIGCEVKFGLPELRRCKCKNCHQKEIGILCTSCKKIKCGGYCFKCNKSICKSCMTNTIIQTISGSKKKRCKMFVCEGCFFIDEKKKPKKTSIPLRIASHGTFKNPIILDEDFLLDEDPQPLSVVPKVKKRKKSTVPFQFVQSFGRVKVDINALPHHLPPPTPFQNIIPLNTTQIVFGRTYLNGLPLENVTTQIFGQNNPAGKFSDDWW